MAAPTDASCPRPCASVSKRRARPGQKGRHVWSPRRGRSTADGAAPGGCPVRHTGSATRGPQARGARHPFTSRRIRGPDGPAHAAGWTAAAADPARPHDGHGARWHRPADVSAERHPLEAELSAVGSTRDPRAALVAAAWTARLPSARSRPPSHGDPAVRPATRRPDSRAPMTPQAPAGPPPITKQHHPGRGHDRQGPGRQAGGPRQGRPQEAHRPPDDDDHQQRRSTPTRRR